MQDVLSRAHPVAGILRVLRISQQKAAQGTSYSPQYFGRVINGLQPASREFRRRVAAYLNLPEGDLFDGETS
jgi:hypothetical protein